MKAQADNPKFDGLFARRAAKKDAVRMSEYRDPKYAIGMEALFGGAIKPPQRGRIRF
jgi:hypothetical protein